MEILDGCQCKCSWFFPGCITTAYGETKNNGNNQNTTELKKPFNRLLLELIKNVHLSSFFGSALSEGPYQPPPSPQLFAKQCPQRSLLHFLISARGTQFPSRGICDLLVSLSRNSPSASPWAQNSGTPSLSKAGMKETLGFTLQEFGTSSPKPWNHLRLGKVLLPFSWAELGMSGVCRIQLSEALFSWFLNGFLRQREILPRRIEE